MKAREMKARSEMSASTGRRGWAALVLGVCAAAMLWLPLSAAGDIGFGDVTASDYVKKMKITFAGYNHNPPMDTLTNFPVLVVLSNSVDGSNFTYDDFDTSHNGYDLTFTSDDGTTIIPHEVDGTWTDGGTNWVWVRVPELVDTTTFIWAYWGKSGAARPAYTTNGAVWVDYGIVLHFGDATALNVNDSSPYRKTYTVNGGVTAAAGKIRGGGAFNGSTGWIDLGTSATQLIASVKTISVWAVNKGTSKTAYWYDRGQNKDEWGQDGLVYEGTRLAIVQPKTPFGQTAFLYTTLAHGDYLSFSYNGTSVHSDRNGGQNSSDVTLVAAPTNNPSYRSAIGRAGDYNDYYFNGTLDEFRIARVARSADWIWAEYTSMGDPMAFNQYADPVSFERPVIATLAPTNVTAETAFLNGDLTSTGTATEVWVGVFWGNNDGGDVTNDTDGVWDHANWFPTSFTTLGPISTNMPLDAELDYGDRWYRFAVTNASGGWGQGESQYFINTNVWVTKLDDAAEPDETGTFRIARPAGATGGSLTVTYTPGGDAVAGTHYIDNVGTQVTFAVGQSEMNIVVTPIYAGGDPNDRTLTLTLNAGSYVTGTASSASMTITNFQATGGILQFSSPTYSKTEGNSGSDTVIITVRRTEASDGVVTVNYATVVEGSTATSETDYTPASGTLTFVEGDTEETFTVSITGDTTPESDETVNLTLSNPSATALLGAQKTAVLTILDDDVATFTWDHNGEGSGVKNWSDPLNWNPDGVPTFNAGDTLKLTRASYTGSATVNLNGATGDIKLGGIDYGTLGEGVPWIITRSGTQVFKMDGGGSNAKISWGPGGDWGSVSDLRVPMVLYSDLDINNTSTRGSYLYIGATTLGITSAGGLRTITNISGPGGDPPFTTWVTIAGVIGDGAGQIQVVNNAASTFALTGANTFTGGAVVQQGRIWATNPGMNANNLTVNGGYFEPYTDASVKIGGLAGTASGTVRSQYNASRTLEISPASGSYTFPGTLANQGSGVLSVTKTGNGTQILSGTSTYTGATAVNVGTLLVNGSLAAGSAVTVNGGILGGTGTINGSVTVTSGTLRPGASIGKLTVGNNISHAAASIFAWEAKGYVSESDTGTAGTDYSQVAMTAGQFTIAGGTLLRLHFPAGEDFSGSFWDSARTWDIVTGGSGSSSGSIAEGDISVYVNSALYDGGDCAITGQGAFSTSYVADGKLRLTWTTSAGTLSFTADDFPVTEGNSDSKQVAVTVSRWGGTAGAVSVNWTTSDGTATTADNEYMPGSGTLNWETGVGGNQTFYVTINGDTAIENDETINLTLSNAGGGASIGTGDATVTIQNDDAATGGILQFSSATYSKTEGNAGSDTVTITVTRTDGTTGEVTVNYATSAGTATAGDDYTAANGTLTFVDGDTEETFTVSITGDTTPESDETINLTLSNPSATALLGAQKTAVLTILDDEPKTYTWDHNGENSDVKDWSTAVNWSGDVVPTFRAGDTLRLTRPSASGTATVNLDPATGSITLGTIDYVTIGEQSPFYITRSGAQVFNMNGGGSAAAIVWRGANWENVSRFEVPIVLYSDLEFNNTINRTVHLFVNNPTTMGITSAGGLRAIINKSTGISAGPPAWGSGVQIAGIIGDGAGQVKVVQNSPSPASSMTLTGANTFSGGVFVESGGIYATSAGMNANDLTVNGGYFEPYTDASVKIGGLAGTISGTVRTFPDVSKTLEISPASGTYTFPGTLANQGSGVLSVTKTGNGTQILSGTSTYTGATAVNAGTLLVNGSLTSPVTVNSGGTLGGTGTITGNVEFKAGSAMQVDAGDSPNHMEVTGAVTLTGSPTLAAVGTLTEPSYTVLTATSVTGTFNPTSRPPGYVIEYTETTVELRLNTSIVLILR